MVAADTQRTVFCAGRPMVVLPLFWDQVDNAQRVAEASFGVRLPAHEASDADLAGATERLLSDRVLPRSARCDLGPAPGRPGHRPSGRPYRPPRSDRPVDRRGAGRPVSARGAAGSIAFASSVAARFRPKWYRSDRDLCPSSRGGEQ